jgi:hypothetical protein
MVARLIFSILFLIFPSIVFAFSSANTWYIRTDGGTYSQCSGVSDAAYTSGTAYTGTDLVVDGVNNLKVTSASHTFVGGEVGQSFIIFGGAGWTTGTYTISSVSSGAAILDSSPASVGTTAGKYHEGPACAFAHPSWLQVTNYNTTALFVGGDTVIFDNIDRLAGSGQAKYVIGYTMPNIAGPNCAPSAAAYACNLNAFPGGPDSAHKTKIYGKGYASCASTSPSGKAQIWGQGYVQLIGLSGSNFDVQCLELTDHSSCLYAGPSDGTVDGFPTKCSRTGVGATDGDWAQDGIITSGTNNNLSFSNLDVHGIGRYGIEIGGDNSAASYGDISLTNVKVIANGWGGFQTNNQMSSSASNTVSIDKSIVDWNGCGERYPLQSSLDSSANAHHCSSQVQIASAADGIAFGNGASGQNSNWTITNSMIRWNTQDGFDILHGSNASPITVNIQRTLFEGNAGNAIKTTAKYNFIENNAFVGNCGFFHGQTFTNTKDGSGTPTGFDNCRAGGSPIVYNVGAGFRFLFYNNTVITNGRYVLEGAHGTDCDANTLNQIRNNILYGGYSWENDTAFNGAGDNSLVGFWLYGTDGGTCTGSFDALDEDYNIVYQVKDFSSCTGAHSKCNQDPTFTGTIKQGHGTDASYYQGTDYAAQLSIPSGSIAHNNAYSGLTYQNGSTDYTGASRPPWDIGSLIVGSSITGIGGGGTPPTCFDGIQNGSETGVDCGGSCGACGGGGGGAVSAYKSIIGTFSLKGFGIN